MQDQWQFINVFDIGCIDDILLIDVALPGNFALQLIADRLITTTNDQVGLNPARSQFGDAMLCWFCLLLATWTNKWHQCHMHVTDIVTTNFIFVLADGFKERQNFDVANGSSNFGNHHVDIICSQTLNATFDLISDMWNDLHSAT